MTLLSSLVVVHQLFFLLKPYKVGKKDLLIVVSLVSLREPLVLES